jgi:YidC/Oxa1 family membrane protein insertase
MKKDPEQYRAKKQKLNEEMMALYQREGVNPMASCLPLLAQAPIFFALFSILRGDRARELADQPFYFITRYTDDGLTSLVSQAMWPGWLLIALMAGTMFLSTKQTMASQPTAGGDNPMAQQQKIMLYVMPVFLAVISFNFPLGVLLYWVTTNTWQAVQQWFMLREVKHEVEEGTLAEHPGGEAAGRTGPGKSPKKGKRSKGKGPASGATSSGGAAGGSPSPGATSGKGGKKPGTGKKPDTGSKPDSGGRNGASPSGKGGSKGGEQRPRTNGSGGKQPKRDHLPRRGDRR